MYTVTVLTPRGRRQQVKVTPNTTILQILEEVCKKHGFNAQEYDLRHHNKILDVSSMFRFTSLINNAQLEMTEALNQRREFPVTLGLQFENGERVTGEFSPVETVWNVIISLKPEEEEKSSDLVVIYMRQEIYGVENLKRTTLRSLGLTSGRAMLRVLHKSPEELHVQANVSSALPPRGSAPEIPEENATKKEIPEENATKKEIPEENATKKEIPAEKAKTPSPELVKRKTPSPPPSQRETTKYTTDAFNLRGNILEKLLRDEKSKKKSSGSDGKNSESTRISTNYHHHKEVDDLRRSPESKTKTEAVVPNKVKDTEDKAKEESKIILLGDRNAVAFNLNSIKPTESEEEPDDFFDLTIYDAKILLKQAKQLCADLEDAPLMTSAQREFEKDKKVLSLLNQYKKTVLRIKFPDRTVLQGTFAPLETVSAVEKFVSGYLESPKLKFHLYTTPPKVVLKSDTRLIECGCVPSCVLYFGLPADFPPPSQYLKTEVMEKFSSPSAAALQACELRVKGRKLAENETDRCLKELNVENQNDIDNEEAGPSNRQEWQEKPEGSESSPMFKIPKWFRSNK